MVNTPPVDELLSFATLSLVIIPFCVDTSLFVGEDDVMVVVVVPVLVQGLLE